MGCAGSTQLIVEKEVRYSFPGGARRFAPCCLQLGPRARRKLCLGHEGHSSWAPPLFALFHGSSRCWRRADTPPCRASRCARTPHCRYHSCWVYGPDPRALVLRGRRFARPVLSRRTHSSPGHATLLCTRIAGTRGSNAQCVSIVY